MSTFTDWNGPQGGGARAADLIQLANAYTDLVAKLNQHVSDKTPDTSDVHGIKTYVEAQLKTIKDLIPETSAFITETNADDKYALKTDVPTGVAKADDLKNYAKTTDLNAALTNYLKTNDLSNQKLITDIQADITAIEAALNISDKPDKDFAFEMPALKATKYVEGIMHAVEQVKFTDKVIATVVGGGDSNGKYWLIGMQTDEQQPGIALIKYGNTKPFSAVVSFAASKVNNKYNGALTVVADTVINGLKFKLVYGTDKSGEEHVYLAVQAPDWLVLNHLDVNASGINFCTIGSEGWVAPNGNCHDVIDCFAYTGFSASQLNIKVGEIGDVVAWNKFDTNGVPVDIPANCHICDGSDINPVDWPELIAKGFTTFPLVDYHIIIGSSTKSKPDTEPMFAIRSVANGTGIITLSKESAEAGETILVELDAAPVAIHVLDNVSGTLITATQVDTTNVYTFTMPVADVTVIIDFA